MTKNIVKKAAVLRKYGWTWVDLASKFNVHPATVRSNVLKLQPELGKKYKRAKPGVDWAAVEKVNASVKPMVEKLNSAMALTEPSPFQTQDNTMVFLNPILTSDLSPFVKVKLVRVLLEEGVL